ncbi:MAG: hypothetical protein JST21_09055 [Bacteroidetes bacterium]|nr:hypothetical protein [Bacteroidota bacterium]
MLCPTSKHKAYFILRIASALCFIGHGSFGIITKEIWCNYFGVFGIGRELSYTLMPYVGAMDIIMGLIILFYPLRIVFLWLVIWGFLTALLRPLSGEPFAEFIERGGNYGAPFALLLLTYTSDGKWLKPVKLNDIRFDEKTLKQVKICLRIFVFLLLCGHGWLNLIEKQSLLDQYKSIGFSNPLLIAHIVGAFEIAAALSVLFKPFHSYLLVFFIWKMITELFYPHWELFEFIERSGSYGCILALWYLTSTKVETFSVKNITQSPAKLSV